MKSSQISHYCSSCCKLHSPSSFLQQTADLTASILFFQCHCWVSPGVSRHYVWAQILSVWMGELCRLEVPCAKHTPVITSPLWKFCSWSLGFTSDLLSCRGINSVISRQRSQVQLHWGSELIQMAYMHSREQELFFQLQNACKLFYMQSDVGKKMSQNTDWKHLLHNFRFPS